MLFPFVQLEFTHGIGPSPGRYVVGPLGAAPASSLDSPDAITGVSMPVAGADVLVIGVVGTAASQPGRLRLRRGARDVVPEEPPREVQLLRATVIGGTAPFAERAAAAAFLARMRESEIDCAGQVSAALAVLNRAIEAHRAAAFDPYAIEVTHDDASAVRIGYGTGEQVARGAWTEAIAPPPARLARPKRYERLRPEQVMSEILAGQRGALEGEELLLRASLDVEHGRPRAAAVGLQAGIELASAELSAGVAKEALRKVAGPAAALARAARSGALDTVQRAELERLLTAAELALGDWRAHEPAAAPAGARTSEIAEAGSP